MGSDLGNSIRTLVDEEVEFERDKTRLGEERACKNAGPTRGTPVRQL
jgi:hypothetical protein